MKSLKFRLKLTSKIFFISIFTLLSFNGVFAISVNTSTTFQSNCPWALVNSNIYITWATQKIYPTDLMISVSKLLFVRNGESSVSIWQNTANTLSPWCSQPFNATDGTWWGRLSNVVPWTNQYVWIFSNFWNICDVNKVKRIDTLRPSVQFVYRVAYKEEVSRATWTNSYFYYPYISWALQQTQSLIPDQTTRNWWDIKYHSDECHNFTFSYCWDWLRDASHWETCDDWNNIDWDGCSAVCNVETWPACNSLIAVPSSWNAPLTSAFTCNATSATSYRIDIFSWATILNTINTRTGSYTFANNGSYTARCTINWNITSAACLVPITAAPVVPNIDIDKRDANPADLDLIIWNDTQTVSVWTQARFRIRATNNFNESLRNIVLTDTVSPNCAGAVTLPGTFPATWTGTTVWWSWDHTNATLEIWEYIDYICNGANTIAWYTNSATVTWIWVTSNISVTDTDTTVVLIPGWGWSQPDCIRIELSNSWSTANHTYPLWTNVWVTCIWSANTEIVRVDCWDWTSSVQNNARIWNFTCVYNSLATFNPRCYVWNWATSWIANVTSDTCNTKLSWWGWGWWGWGGWSKWFCWDWVVQRPNDQWLMEECEKMINRTTRVLEFPSWCVDCKTSNFTYPWEGGWVFTYPWNWNIFFKPFWQVLIWAWKNPFEVYGTFPFISNNSSEDLYLDYPLCVHNSDSSALIRPNNTWFTKLCSAQNIGWMYPWVTKTYEDLNNWTPINVKSVKIDNVSFKDAILKITIWDFKDAFFAAVFRVRVSKPAVATVWGWTSLIKSNNVTADINKVSSNWFSNPNKNKNFVWAWVSTGSVSSYTKIVDNTNSVTKISSWQTQKVEKNITKITTTTTSWNKNIWDTLDKYNWLSNVFIVKNWDLTINAIISWNGERTYIIEWWNLYINQNITYANNIAFVVKWWNIIISSNVTKINGTFIAIKVWTVWWSISSAQTDEKLVVNWSLYGNIEALVNNRTYIQNKNDLINVWTVVSFGSSLFRKQAPLVWDFIWEYVKSKKVAK